MLLMVFVVQVKAAEAVVKSTGGLYYAGHSAAELRTALPSQVSAASPNGKILEADTSNIPVA